MTALLLGLGELAYSRLYLRGLCVMTLQLARAVIHQLLVTFINYSPNYKYPSFELKYFFQVVNIMETIFFIPVPVIIHAGQPFEQTS